MWDMTGAVGTQLALLGLAALLSGLVGVEREYHQKDAGIRTHMLVGLGAALFTVVSSYGFADLVGDRPADPGRIAAQVVTGVGFLGAGVIFTRRSTVHGLTTAATVWLVAAVGVACGAGLPIAAAATTLGYLALVPLLGALGSRMPVAARLRTLDVRYVDGAGVLREILAAAADTGHTVAMESSTVVEENGEALVEVRLRLDGRLRLDPVVQQVAGLDGVRHVATVPDDPVRG